MPQSGVPSNARMPLRPYQEEMRRRVFAAWECRRGVMAQMPTGTGKTRLLAAVIYDWLEETEHKSVWIVAHRRELVEQIEETVARYGMKPNDGRVKVLSIQWLSRHLDDLKDERPSLIVIDEAHHALAETYKALWLRYPDARKLGMTATPCRLDRKGFTDLFEVLVASDGIAEFIRQGWLSPFDYVSIRPDSEDQRLIDGLEKRGADGDFQVKEMDSVLNRRPTIERLYESVRQYAGGKKGIVYAVSISHARNIAAYYNNKGMNAVAIDSRTPARLRRQMVEDFRQGKIQVLVNVDVFSEGFDCPDVEFVQLARPTLSLSKYLQQVGRGLRRTSGKETCVLIDNVGLYRLFGLPASRHDWQAMFEGRLAGKGCPAPDAGGAAYMAASQAWNESADGGGMLETVMSHGRLMDCLQNGGHLPGICRDDALKAFKDRGSGRWGLRRGRVITVPAQYQAVFDVKGDWAAVKFGDGGVGVVDGEGRVQMKAGRCGKVGLLPDGIAVAAINKRDFYVDLLSAKQYGEKPVVKRFGAIGMLKVGKGYYSRTRRVYEVRPGVGEYDFVSRGFYLRIRDYGFRLPGLRYVGGTDAFLRDCVCILENDPNEYYWFCGELDDGSIVVADEKGNYYHASEGAEKRYVACVHPASEEEDFDVAVSRLKAEAAMRAAETREAFRREEERQRRERLSDMRSAVPFQSGRRWGLALGGRVIVPPVYLSIRPPVGYYCAVEANPRQWGIIMLDGKLVVEARYMKVEIKADGTARLTVYPGKTKVVKLKA